MTKTYIPANEKAVLRDDHWRISVLTPQMFRLEYSEQGDFTDEMTQKIVCRDFPVPAFTVKNRDGELQIITENAELHYDGKPFSKSGLSIRVRGNGGSGTWHYGETGDSLPGTARTLDQAEGEDLMNGTKLKLEDSLFAMREGYSVIDDSRSVTVHTDGTVSSRPVGNLDLYFFGYGHRFHEGLRDFYRLTGRPPLIPRFALGNWWSRYYKYTEQEYKDLIRHFEADRVPLSVAVIDMDWHLVDIDPKYGSGWTGYTWNPELFPDYREFLAWLHQHGLRTALNIHPADGVRAYEAMYPQMAEALGRNAAEEEPIPFDITDPEYVKAAFQYIYHPYEKDGVDFWWLDWQQGAVTRIPGLDPLWMINRSHYVDSCRNGKRGLTFSRYAGIGSHRYPIGFSGDTISSWKSLDYQPFFTASASNTGFGWWSHDIGGHMLGAKDEELTVRWVQYGVFSPIMRLHSSDCEFMHKEPWLFSPGYKETLERYLRLRHSLIPYLYTMNVRASRDGVPLVQPLYYGDPENWELYRHFRNEYYFGDSLLVSPVTQARDKTGFAEVKTWIPDGGWTDLFSGVHYRGKRQTEMVRDLSDIPVLAKDGAVLPMTDLSTEELYTASTDSPEHLLLKVFPGKDGAFEMLEDDGTGTEYQPEHWCSTVISQTSDPVRGTVSLTIGAASGNVSCVPGQRTWRAEFYLDGFESLLAAGAASPDAAYAAPMKKELPYRTTLSASGSVDSFSRPDLGKCVCGWEIRVSSDEEIREVSWDSSRNVAAVSFGPHAAGKELNVILALSPSGTGRGLAEEADAARESHLVSRLYGVLMEANAEYLEKQKIGDILHSGCSRSQILSDVLTSKLPEKIKEAYAELILAEE
ncbi:MAG: TIM-barrel domain-containing protein [Lachnospiraceae bacterium]